MTTLEQRIEKAARDYANMSNLDWSHEGVRYDCRRAASQWATLLLPEFHTAPPTHWLAPWSATEDMVTKAAGTEAMQLVDGAIGVAYAHGFRSPLLSWDKSPLAQAYAAFRDAHLAEPVPDSRTA
mgnify:CR=1 FL=1